MTSKTVQRSMPRDRSNSRSRSPRQRPDYGADERRKDATNDGKDTLIRRERSRSRDTGSPARKRHRDDSISRSRSRSRERRRKHRSRSRSRERDRGEKRRRARSISSSSDSTEGISHRRKEHRKDKSRDGKRTKSKERRKEKRREKKEKKEKKKREKGSTLHWGKYGIISDVDIFTKNQEFYTWLVEERKINPETVSKEQQKRSSLALLKITIQLHCPMRSTTTWKPTRDVCQHSDRENTCHLQMIHMISRPT